jgi:predicted nuclease of restriction endonuclease-like RecB superfamily
LGDERGKWCLTREDEVLLLGDSVMIPDLAFTHKEDGRRALVEIVGFWHPEYLRRKLAKVRAAGRDDLILLVYEGVNLADDKLQDVPGEVLYFASKPVIKQVIAAVERQAR